MSSVSRDMVEGYENIARRIQGFLWEGKPNKSARIERSTKELEEFLEDIRKECWNNYDSGAYDMGWKD